MSTRVWGRVSDLVTCPPVVVSEHAGLISVARTLWEREVGVALVAADDGRIVGLVSERDLVAALALGRPPESTPVTSVMNESIVAVDQKDSLYDAAVDMLDLGIRHVPVTDGSGHYTGVVSIRDLLRPLLVRSLGG